MSDNTSRPDSLLLVDSPATHDSFGSHSRIARALVETIARDHGGIAIGLEGTWGSGKSTVVSLAKTLLAQQQPDTEMLVFDAWAHHGDPLRRVVLETVIRTLMRRRWIDIREDGPWARQILSLQHRLKVTTTSRKTELTGFAKLLGFLAPVASIGAIVLNHELSENTISVRFWEPGLQFSFYGLSLILMVLSPVLAALGAMAVLIRRQGSQSIAALKAWWKYMPAIAREAGEETVQSETSEDTEPTSVEFQEIFSRLLREALESNNSRRFVLVFDNLDRVEATDARSILSSLQAFMLTGSEQAVQTSDLSWRQRLWVILPYDADGLSPLGTGEGRGLVSSVGARVAPDTRSRNAQLGFVEKLMPVRFFVPALPLTDWKDFLVERLMQALPDTSLDVADTIYLVYARYWRSRSAEHPEHGSVAPTPRNVTSFVNQLVALQRQWPESGGPSLAVMAHFALLRRDNTPSEIANMLISRNAIRGSLVELLGEEAPAWTAALLLNTEHKKAGQLLLEEPIREALSSGNGQRLVEFEGSSLGFWEVIAELDLKDLSPKALAGACKAESESGLFSANGPHRAKNSAIKQIESAFLLRTHWPEIDEVSASSLCGILTFTRDLGKTSAHLLKTVFDLRSIRPDRGEGAQIETADIERWFDAAVSTARKCAEHTADLRDSINIIGVPLDWDKYVVVTSLLVSRGIEKPLWAAFAPSSAREREVIDGILSNVGASLMTTEYRSACLVLAHTTLHNDINRLLDVIVQRLRPGTALTSEDMSSRMALMWQLQQELQQNPTELAHRISANTACARLYEAANRADVDGQVMCLFTILHVMDDLPSANSDGNAAPGVQSFTQLFQNPGSNPSLLKQLSGYCVHVGDFAQLVDAFSGPGAYHNGLRYCVSTILDGAGARSLLEKTPLFDHWDLIGGTLDHPIQKKVAALLAPDSSLLARLCATDFDIYRASIGFRIAQEPTEPSVEFLGWCQTGLNKLSRGQWVQALDTCSAEVQLLLTLTTRGCEMTLGTEYLEALVVYANRLADGTPVPDAYNTEDLHIDHLPGALSPQLRVNLRVRLRNLMEKREASYSPGFFTVFSDDLPSVEELLSREDLIVIFFDGSIARMDLAALGWIESQLGEGVKWSRTGLLGSVINRLNGMLIDNPVQGEAEGVLKRLRSRFDPRSDEAN